MREGCLGTETLIDFLEGRADDALRGRVEEHASRCEACREVLSALAREGTPPVRGEATARRGDVMLEPGARVGRYVVSHQLGAGGMGVVYAARDPELGRAVAVKLLHAGGDPRLHERLRREAQAMAQLTHPNVVAVYDVGAFEDRMFIAMEHVDGDTLARWLSVPRSQRDILEVYLAAGRGLAAAHASGIVHRDFKPENVLIGSDGRVRVGDFGLARTSSAAGEPPGLGFAGGSDVGPTPDGPPGAPAGRTTLTASGTLLGTPYYIAPELYRGAEADARSDQFSYCVALFTALYGERPFGGDTLAALAAGTRTARLGDPQRRAHIPRRIRAALRRGLSLDPGARFASLDELLAELVPSRHRARWAIGLGVAVAAIAWLVALPARAPDERCTGAAAAFARTWNAERRVAIATTFLATGTPYAAAVQDHVIAAFDQYAARWQRAHTDACRATRILGEQTEAMLELRMTCLERRRQDMAALVTTLTAAPRSIVDRSVHAVGQLPDVAGCADLAALRQIVAPPGDAISRAKLAGLAARLADARASAELGAYPRALELVRPIVAEARALGYLPFQSEAEFMQARVEFEVNDLASAEATLNAAIWSAEAGRHDELAARAWGQLVFLVGYSKAEYARVPALVSRATAARARLGGNADIESRLEDALGAIEGSQDRYDTSIAHFEKAVALTEQSFGPDHLELAIPLLNLASTILNRGDAAHAIPILHRALGIQERALGPHHPHVARTLTVLGDAHNTTGQLALAEEELRRALAIREASLGPGHPEIATNLGFLGEALADQGKIEEAVAVDRRAVAIGETAYGAEHPRFAYLLLEATWHLGQRGLYTEAHELLRRCESILAKHHGPDHVDVMRAVVARGHLAILQSRWREAVELYQRALPGFERAHIANRSFARAVINLECAHLELRQPERGLARLERLVRDPDDVRPDLRIAAEFTLARALWETGRDRERARELAARALAGLEQLPVALQGDALRIRQWLATHPARER